MSLWSWVNQPSELSKFTNPLFEANALVIWPSVAPQSLQLWEGKVVVLGKLGTCSWGGLAAACEYKLLLLILGHGELDMALRPVRDCLPSILFFKPHLRN